MTATTVTHALGSGRSGADFFGLFADWRRRRRYRAELARLLRTGPHLVDDIGLTMSDAARAAVLPFWR